MIVVVADTSPLNYLVQIHCQHLLPALYERVFVPSAVVKELSHSGTPAIVRVWLRQIPDWKFNRHRTRRWGGSAKANARRSNWLGKRARHCC